MRGGSHQPAPIPSHRAPRLRAGSSLTRQARSSFLKTLDSNFGAEMSRRLPLEVHGHTQLGRNAGGLQQGAHP